MGQYLGCINIFNQNTLLVCKQWYRTFTCTEATKFWSHPTVNSLMTFWSEELLVFKHAAGSPLRSYHCKDLVHVVSSTRLVTFILKKNDQGILSFVHDCTRNVRVWETIVDVTSHCNLYYDDRELVFYVVLSGASTYFKGPRFGLLNTRTVLAHEYVYFLNVWTKELEIFDIQRKKNYLSDILEKNIPPSYNVLDIKCVDTHLYVMAYETTERKGKKYLKHDLFVLTAIQKPQLISRFSNSIAVCLTAKPMRQRHFRFGISPTSFFLYHHAFTHSFNLYSLQSGRLLIQTNIFAHRSWSTFLLVSDFLCLFELTMKEKSDALGLDCTLYRDFASFYKMQGKMHSEKNC